MHTPIHNTQHTAHPMPHEIKKNKSVNTTKATVITLLIYVYHWPDTVFFCCFFVSHPLRLILHTNTNTQFDRQHIIDNNRNSGYFTMRCPIVLHTQTNLYTWNAFPHSDRTTGEPPPLKHFFVVAFIDDDDGRCCVYFSGRAPTAGKVCPMMLCTVYCTAVHCTATVDTYYIRNTGTQPPTLFRNTRLSWPSCD